MSVAASAAPSGGTSTASTAGQGSENGNQSANQSNSQASSKSGSAGQTQSQAGSQAKASSSSEKDAGNSPGKQESSVVEELEELKLGHISAKVPKELAKAIKELERGFHGSRQQIAQVERYFQGIAEKAKSNPRVADEILQKLGIDSDKYSQARLAEKLQYEMMTEEQRENLKLKQENERFKETQKEREDREAKDKEQKDYQTKSAQIRAEATTAIGKDELIRDDPFLVANVIAEKARAEKQGLDWTWDDCVAKVGSTFRAALRSRLSTLPPEKFESEFGADLFEKVREYALKRVIDKTPSQAGFSKSTSPGGSPATSSNNAGSKKALSEKEYQAYFERLANGQ